MEGTYHQTPSSSHALPILLIFAAFCGLAFAVATAPARPAAAPAVRPEVIVDDYSHSAIEHPLDQPTVRRCLSDKNTLKQDFTTPQPGRYLRTCYDGQHVVFQVIDRVGSVLKEKTAYIRGDFRNMSDVTRYVDRVNYYRIPGGLK